MAGGCSTPVTSGVKHENIPARCIVLDHQQALSAVATVLIQRHRVLTRSEDVFEIFRDSHNHIKAPANHSGWLFAELLGDCLGLISGAPYKTLHAALKEPFNQRGSAGQLAAIQDVTSRHFRALLASQPDKQDRRFHVVRDFEMLPFRVVARMLYGDLSDHDEAELQALIGFRAGVFRRSMQGGLLRFRWAIHLYPSVKRSLREFQNRWADFNMRIARRNGDASLVGQLLRQAEIGPITARQVHQTLDEMLFANLDVAAGSLAWHLLLLSAHPDAQHVIRTEAAQAQQNSDETGDPAKWDAYLCSSSSYLASAVLEAARLKPLAAFTVPQAAPTSRVVGPRQFVVPAGMSYIVDTQAINMGQQFWGADASAYRLERWSEKRATDVRYNYWRFGFGPRNCLGRHIADLVMKCLTIEILKAGQLIAGPETSRALEERKRDCWIAMPDASVGFREFD
ncbi:MAG: hypothetical protein Q9159_000295 [Coniocarpon cinnabarinum]